MLDFQDARKQAYAPARTVRASGGLDGNELVLGVAGRNHQ
jgi:hypothetical protein